MAAPPDEAEAYRLDRIETRKLNNAERDTLAVPVKKMNAPSAVPTPTRIAKSEEQALRSREERALEVWRRRGIACHSGNRASCD